MVAGICPILPGQTFNLRVVILRVPTLEDKTLSTAPRIDIDLGAFWNDPYPTLAKLRKEAPIAFVPQLGCTLLCSRDDISISEKKIDVFSSDQPEGLMTKTHGPQLYA